MSRRRGESSGGTDRRDQRFDRALHMMEAAAADDAERPLLARQLLATRQIDRSRLEQFDHRIRERLVDPLPIVRAHVYDNAFLGSFSIKYVAPALLGEAMSYEGMKVSNGTDAQVAYEQLISGTLDSTSKAALRDAMLEYCRKDTIAIVNLVEWLRNAATNSGQSAA